MLCVRPYFDVALVESDACCVLSQWERPLLTNMWQLWFMLLACPKVEITGLYRYPVKGASFDTLEQVGIQNAGETFPDDRRYALLWNKNANKWEETNPEWLHKENFLCAFTNPKLFSEYLTSYQIVSNEPFLSYGTPCDKVNQESAESQRLLTIKTRSTGDVVLGPVNLSTVDGREQVSSFFSKKSGKDVICVTAASDEHTHQFGNTSSGVKARADTRTVHIVNAATVRELSKSLQMPINPTRFRPNIVLDGLEPWEEFQWVDKYIKCGNMRLSVIKQTVRCNGVSIDPLDPERVMDIPRLLTKHYPKYGPYFGVYAIIDEAGTMSIGDNVILLE